MIRSPPIKRGVLIVTSIIFVAIILFNVKVYTIISGSMQPHINIGDVVIVKKERNYKVNDVITFKLQDTTVSHRIVAIKEEGYVTKGDFNKVNDIGIVSKDKVVGKVIFVIPMIGLLAIYVRQYCFVLLIAVLIIYIRERIRKNGKEKI